MPTSNFTPGVRDALAAAVDGRLATGVEVRRQHAGLESHHGEHLPDVVVFPRSTDEVVNVLRVAGAYRVPVIPFGAGTSLEGHVAAVAGGICLDLSGLDRMIDVRPGDLLCTVEAGVTREALNHHLRDQGLFFSVDPGANATLGGMVATRASGTNAVRYGTMRENVLSLKVVLPDGRVTETGCRAPKSAAGYDLTALFIGSEGTLGVVTEVTVRLRGIPEVTAAAVCPFATLGGAVDTVMATIQAGVPVARIELLDAHQIAACNADAKLDLPEQPTLFFEFHGSVQGVAESATLTAEFARERGGPSFTWATANEDRTRLWRARHHAYFAAKAFRPGCIVWVTDVCVPILALLEVIVATRTDIDEAGLSATMVGHVGDGNFHVLFLLDPDSNTERKLAYALNDRMIARALAVGGTCTGEHGIGLGKRDALVQERGETATALMRAIKQTLDPAGIMNPGKIFGA